MVRDLEERVKLAKFNVEEINKIMSKWCIQPLYQRKEDKKDSLLNTEVHVCTCTHILYIFINFIFTIHVHVHCMCEQLISVF